MCFVWVPGLRIERLSLGREYGWFTERQLDFS